MRTVYIRTSMTDRGGVTGIAHVQLVTLGTDKPVVAYLGEYRGEHEPIDTIASAAIADDADPWVWVAEQGFQAVPDEGS